MASTTFQHFASRQTDRGVSTAALSLALIASLALSATMAAFWRSADIKARDKKPQIIMVTPYGHADLVDFSGLSETALASVARTAIRDFIHGYYSRNPETIIGDLAKSWSMLSETQRADRRQEFAKIASDFASNPSQQVQVNVADVTLVYSRDKESLKDQYPHSAIVDFQKVFMADGHELHSELWTVTVIFHVQGQPEQGSDMDADNALGVTISDFHAQRAL